MSLIRIDADRHGDLLQGYLLKICVHINHFLKRVRLTANMEKCGEVAQGQVFNHVCVLANVEKAQATCLLRSPFLSIMLARIDEGSRTFTIRVHPMHGLVPYPPLQQENSSNIYTKHTTIYAGGKHHQPT